MNVLKNVFILTPIKNKSNFYKRNNIENNIFKLTENPMVKYYKIVIL